MLSSIPTSDLKKMIGRINIIDIRDNYLYKLGSIPTSKNIPMNFLLINPDDYLKIEKDIKEALDNLVDARILILNESQYRITSDIEQRLLDEMNEFAVQSYVRKSCK